MTEARTLLQMAGAPSSPPPLDRSALVMIDCQREYVDGKVPLAGVEGALTACAEMLAAARGAGAPVIHVQHKGRAGGLFDPDTAAFRIADPAAPEAGEPSITKALPNAFAGTELDAMLRETGRESVIFAGFMTHMCVSSTVRAALDLGHGAVVVAAACATRDLPDGRGGVVTAAELHRAELAARSDRFAIIVPDASALATG
jgi:nicotinamidase-related amidase